MTDHRRGIGGMIVLATPTLATQAGPTAIMVRMMSEGMDAEGRMTTRATAGGENAERMAGSGGTAETRRIPAPDARTAVTGKTAGIVAARSGTEEAVTRAGRSSRRRAEEGSTRGAKASAAATRNSEAEVAAATEGVMSESGTTVKATVNGRTPIELVMTVIPTATVSKTVTAVMVEETVKKEAPMTKTAMVATAVMVTTTAATTTGTGTETATAVMLLKTLIVITMTVIVVISEVAPAEMMRANGEIVITVSTTVTVIAVMMCRTVTGIGGMDTGMTTDSAIVVSLTKIESVSLAMVTAVMTIAVTETAAMTIAVTETTVMVTETAVTTTAVTGTAVTVIVIAVMAT